MAISPETKNKYAKKVEQLSGRSREPDCDKRINLTIVYQVMAVLKQEIKKDLPDLPKQEEKELIAHIFHTLTHGIRVSTHSSGKREGAKKEGALRNTRISRMAKKEVRRGLR